MNWVFFFSTVDCTCSYSFIITQPSVGFRLPLFSNLTEVTHLCKRKKTILGNNCALQFRAPVSLNSPELAYRIVL